MSASPGIHTLDAVRMLRSAGEALSVQALLHGQLAQVEWEEEKVRLLKIVIATMLGFACLLCVLLLAGALLLAATWGTAYRLPAAASLLLVYGSGVAIAWRRVQDLAALRHQGFAASREELLADAALLKASL